MPTLGFGRRRSPEVARGVFGLLAVVSVRGGLADLLGGRFTRAVGAEGGPSLGGDGGGGGRDHKSTDATPARSLRGLPSSFRQSDKSEGPSVSALPRASAARWVEAELSVPHIPSMPDARGDETGGWDSLRGESPSLAAPRLSASISNPGADSSSRNPRRLRPLRRPRNNLRARGCSRGLAAARGGRPLGWDFAISFCSCFGVTRPVVRGSVVIVRTRR